MLVIDVGKIHLSLVHTRVIITNLFDIIALDNRHFKVDRFSDLRHEEFVCSIPTKQCSVCHASSVLNQVFQTKRRNLSQEWEEQVVTSRRINVLLRKLESILVYMTRLTKGTRRKTELKMPGKPLNSTQVNSIFFISKTTIKYNIPLTNTEI